MNINHVIPYCITRQQIVIEAQRLAFKMPELGINSDALGYETIDELTGILAFLKRMHSDKHHSD